MNNKNKDSRSFYSEGATVMEPTLTFVSSRPTTQYCNKNRTLLSFFLKPHHHFSFCSSSIEAVSNAHPWMGVLLLSLLPKATLRFKFYGPLPQPNILVKLLARHWPVSKSKHNGLVNWPGSQTGAMQFTAMLTITSLFLLLKEKHLSTIIPLIATDNLKVSTHKLAQI